MRIIVLTINGSLKLFFFEFFTRCVSGRCFFFFLFLKDDKKNYFFSCMKSMLFVFEIFCYLLFAEQAATE